MHDLKFCLRRHGKMYCWDEAVKRVVRVTIDDLRPDECPNDVMEFIMERLTAAQKGKEE